MSEFKLSSVNLNSFDDVSKITESINTVDPEPLEKLSDYQSIESESIKWEDSEEALSDDYLEELDITLTEGVPDEVSVSEDKKKDIVNSIVTAIWVSNSSVYDENEESGSYEHESPENNNYGYWQEIIYLSIFIVFIVLLFSSFYFNYSDQRLDGIISNSSKEYSYELKESISRDINRKNGKENSENSNSLSD